VRTISAALILIGSIACTQSFGASDGGDTTVTLFSKADGYRGIWYSNQESGDQYRFKYSGGFATYPQQHTPIAIYAPAVRKTFFCYGGRSAEKNELLHMVSYFDHETSTVPRPTILLNKKTTDAHDNPIMSIDDKGHIWIFSPSHGGARPTFIHRSVQPYSIDSFTSVPSSNYSYPQAWYFPGHGFLFLHTIYQKGRSLFWSTSKDGTEWSKPALLSRFGEGHYQISRPHGTLLATAFNYHPPPLGLNARTNLYYAHTRDFGKSWQNAAGKDISIPMTTTTTAALVRDYEKEGLLVYLKDLTFNRSGNPIVLYLTSRGYEAGPKNDPRQWHTARWTGTEWQIRDVFATDHNYDFGSLYVEEDGTWRIIAPSDPGPQPYGGGGEVVMWTSRNEGADWVRIKALTRDSRFNHTYIRRPVNAHPDFYALWADGDTHNLSASSLYFCNRDGAVWKLPVTMTDETARPEPVPIP
jgi:BNR repeat-containing family member